MAERVLGYHTVTWGGADLTIASTTVYAALPLFSNPDATDNTGVTFPVGVIPVAQVAMIGTASATHGIKTRLVWGTLPVISTTFVTSLLEATGSNISAIYDPNSDPTLLAPNSPLIIPAGQLVTQQAIYVVATSDTDIYVATTFALLQTY